MTQYYQNNTGIPTDSCTKNTQGEEDSYNISRTRV